MAEKYSASEVLAINVRWEKIQVSNVYDALEAMGYPYQCLDLGIGAIAPRMTVVGPAVTLRGHRAAKTAEEAEQTADPNHFKVNAYMYPGCVLVVDGGGEYMSAKVGEFFAWGLKTSGARGAVVDGAVRDADLLAGMKDFSVFAKNISPFPAGKRWFYDEYNKPVALSGALNSQVAVVPGDWIVGGRDGVIVVPQDIMMDVLKEAEKIEKYEIGLREALNNGVPFEKARKMWERK